ncbi:MAG: hypothetical protein E2P02_20845 [Acidobacteria bacterium]|nr:MAG: hypothetical protein E2P02_20845 [Acidobacteriota bacterium]
MRHGSLVLTPPPLRKAARLRSGPYRFGETSFIFESSDNTWLGYLDKRYDTFRSTSSQNTFTLDFESTTDRIPEGMTSPLATHVEAHEIEPRRNGFLVRTATVSATVDLEARRATLQGPRAAYPLDNLLRYLLPALSEQGVLFHSAALEGVIACGPSGAGKSTLASFAGKRALCDELCAVRGNAEGHYRATSLPYWQARPGSTKLQAVLLLRHATRHRLRRVSTSEALRRLSTEILWPVEISSAMERALDQISGLVQSVPVFELAFANDPSAWDFIEEHVLS